MATKYKFSLTDHTPYAKAKERYDIIKAAVDAAEKIPLERLELESNDLKAKADGLAVDALLDESLQKQAAAAASKASKAVGELADEKARRKNLTIALEKARDEMESHREAAELLVYDRAKNIHRELVQNLFAAVRAYAAAYEDEVALSRAVLTATAKQPPSYILPGLLPGGIYMGREDDWNSGISRCVRRARDMGYEV